MLPRSALCRRRAIARIVRQQSDWGVHRRHPMALRAEPVVREEGRGAVQRESSAPLVAAEVGLCGATAQVGFADGSQWRVQLITPTVQLF